MTSEHRIRLELASGASLEMLLFNQHEHTWIQHYHLRRREDEHDHGDVVLFCEQRCVAQYVDGVLGNRITVSMRLVFPQKLGKEFAYGVDISPGAKTYFEFEYQKKGTTFCLVEVIQDSGRPGKRWAVNTPETTEPGLIRQIDFPLPVLDRILYDFGNYAIPFMRDDGSIKNFDLPASTARFQPAGDGLVRGGG